MSMKKAGITIFALLIMLIIILLTIRGCSISKKSEENALQNNQHEVVLKEKQDTTEKESINIETDKKEVEKDEKTSSNTPNNEKEAVKDDRLEISTNNEEMQVSSNPNNEDLSTEESKDLFLEIEEPALGDSMTVSALVSSKKSYLVDNKSYAYSIGVLIPNGEKYEIVNYYCPKKTFDAVSSGESIKVDYQVDKDGKISINSISK